MEVVGRRLRVANRKYLDTIGIVSALAAEGTVMIPENDTEQVLV
jgi:hypothetical protein